MSRFAASAFARSASPRTLAPGPGSPIPTATTTLALGLLTLLTFAHPAASRMHTWPLAGAAFAWWTLPVVLFLLALLRRQRPRLPPVSVLAGLAGLVLAALGSALASPFDAASLPRLWPTFGGVAWVLVLHHVWSGDGVARRAKRFNAIATLSLAGAALVLVSFVGWWRLRWPLPWSDRNSLPFGHSTYTGGAVLLALPWIAVRAWTATTRASRSVWLALTGLALVTLMSTGSRGAVLALAALGGGGALVVVALARWPWRRKAALATAVVCVAVIGVATNSRLRDLIVHRQWSEDARESNAQRSAMLRAGLLLGAERPLVGWGPGTVPLVYPRVRAQLDGGTESVLQLHSTPAQLWATLGAFGLLASALLALAVLRLMFIGPRTPVTLAAGAALISYGVFALTDHQLDVPAINALLAASLAALTSASPNPIRLPARRTRRTVATAVVVIILVVAPATYTDLLARQRYDAALVALSESGPVAYVAALDRATLAAPYDPFFAHQAAFARLEQRLQEPDAARRATLTRDAVERLQTSLRTGVHLEFAHFNLGWLALEQSQPREGLDQFTAAARLVPDKGGVYFGLGLCHDALGDRDAAIRAFALEVVNDPRSITSPAWELPNLAALRPAVLAEAQRLFIQIAPSVPPARAVAAWTQWWAGESATADLVAGFNRTSRDFIAASREVAAGVKLSQPVAAPWAALYEAWRLARAGSAQSVVALRAVSGDDAALAAALMRRVARHSDTFTDFLRAGSEDEAALVRTLRRERTGYGVLALHPEGPMLQDLFVVQENRVATDYGAGLFPPKGWVPGRFLLALLPQNPR